MNISATVSGTSIFLIFQYLTKLRTVRGLSHRALDNTIVTISNIADYSSIYQNIRMLNYSRYELIRNSEQ